MLLIQSRESRKPWITPSMKDIGELSHFLDRKPKSPLKISILKLYSLHFTFVQIRK